MADAVTLCRPEVIGAYPISPQTHIVQRLSAQVKAGALDPCEFINVESEFAAMSVAIGASAAGARAYTATSSQGLLFMVEAVYNAAGMGLPIVMTVANRAIGSPINIWNDHSDSMSQRDSGWIQLYAESNQHALDLHIQAFRIAEELSVPVMVCVDGFVLTHAYEAVDIPAQRQVDAYLPPYAPRQVLDPAEPVSMGAMVGPEAFTEVRYLAHVQHLHALEVIPQVAAEFTRAFGRDGGGLVSRYRTEDAATIVVALGSVLGTVADAVDEARERGERVGAVGITAFRPFPHDAVRDAARHARRIIVLERALAVGSGGIVTQDLRQALPESEGLRIHTVFAGLGGRAIPRDRLGPLLTTAAEGELEPLTFLDLDTGLVEDALRPADRKRAWGPAAEAALRDIGVIEAPRESRKATH